MNVIGRSALMAAALIMTTAGSAAGQAPLEGVMNATVTLSVRTVNGISTGSGFIVTEEGVIVTAAHVLDGGSEGTVRMASGEEFLIEGTLFVDAQRDFALVRVAGFGLPTVTLAASEDLSVGQRVFAVGAPLGLEATVADGLVSALRIFEGTRLMQISTPVSPGSSGGPVANEAGAVVGIVVSGIRGGGAENLNFALPVEYARGQLSLVAGRTPEPLGQGRGALAVRSVGRVTPASQRMNEGLQLAAEPLHGLTYYSTGKEEGLDVTTRTRYAVVPIDESSRKLEQIETVEYFAGRQTVAILEVTSFLALDGLSAGVSRQLRVLDSRSPWVSASLEWVAQNGVVHVDSAGVWVREFPARPGVIPTRLLKGIITALDSIQLPSQKTLWAGEYDPLRGRFVEAYKVIDMTRLSSSASTRRPNLPEQSCAEERLTHGYTGPGIEVEWDGIVSHFHPDLPHFLMKEDTCVSLPRSARPG